MCVGTGLDSPTLLARSPYAALVERLPVRRDELVLRGGRTACWTYGPPDATRTVVFLHGLRGDHHGLEPITAHLDTLRVVVPDLPGFGASPPLPDDAHDVTGYTAWAAELLDAIGRRPGTGGPLVRLGRRGGHRRRRTASRVGAGQPHRGGATGRRDRADRRLPPARRRPAGAGRHRPAAQPGRHPDREPRHGDHPGPGATPLDPRRTRPLLRGLRRPARPARAFHASSTHGVAEVAPAVAVPTLLVAAERDAIAPLATQRALRFPDARLVVVPAVGHLAHYEAPAAVGAAIREFVCGS